MNKHADARQDQVQTKERIKRVIAFLLTGFLIGCVADPNSGLQDAEPQSSQNQISESGDAKSQAPKPAAKQPAAATNEPTTVAPKPEEPPEKIVSAPPLQLLGMSRADIINHLGQPAFQRRDRTALLLRYREEGCILDLFLYPRDQSEPGKAVNYIEARAPNGRRIETRPCIDAVQKANAAG